ncbi:MAG: class I SAM-dependent rRNA methyltransferase [Nitrospirae bacterium]|nr:MAG: class I SAM-dependent rRNA methyltransferase [Nitrospirota bacterium]
MVYYAVVAAPLPEIRLRRGEARRLRLGHPWVFSNEVAAGLKGVAPGEVVQVVDHRGAPVGVGTANPRALICVRLFTRGRRPLDDPLLERRLAAAWELRRRLGLGEAWRWVHSEGDRLPGLVVDRYGDGLVAQPLTAGVERLWPRLLPQLLARARPAWVVLRGDNRGRELEGLEPRVEVAHGELPAAPVVREAGLELRFDPVAGQKTGFFLDQRENRRRWARLCRGERCLDLFCHTGAFALAAAAAGAAEVVAVDRSEAALALAAESAERNRLAGRCRFQRGDAFAFLEQEPARWPRINLDPPAFIRSRKRIREGIAGYERLHHLALRRLAPGGLLLTSSCSHLLDREAFLRVVARAAARARRPVRLLATWGAPPDHPVLPALPESGYLKTLLLQAE